MSEVVQERKKRNTESKETKKPLFLSAGNTLRDLMLGGSAGAFGYKIGKIYNLVGDTSTGKTFLACESIAKNHSIHGKEFVWNYDDCEGGFTFTKDLYGFEIKDKDHYTSKTVEDLYNNIHFFVENIKNNEVGLYVVDSLDALTSKETIERGEERLKYAKKGKEYDKGTYGTNKPKFLSQEFFPKITDLIEQNNVVLLIISQVRDNIGVMFGKKHTRSGGKALDFYCHSVEWLAVSEKLRVIADGKKIDKGVRIKSRTEKSKTPRPFRTVYTTVLFDYGVDDIGSNVDYLHDFITETGKGAAKTKAKLTYNDKEYLRDDFIDFVESEGIEDDIIFDTIKKWETFEDKIKTKRKKKY